MNSRSKKNEYTVKEYIEALKNSPKFGPQVVCHEIFPETSASYKTTFKLSPELQNSLNTQGIKKLYTHQCDALQIIEQDENVIVATPTSSGKSMIYNLPVLDNLLQTPQSQALYLFPLKALAQDQLNTLNTFSLTLPSIQKKWPSGIASIYDGDTTPYQRRKIREQTSPVIITNPEMLHLSFLPFHQNWAQFYSNLKYVIIDEVHTYRGVFGSHISWLMRRLKRILAYYDNQATFIMSSATIGNPETFSKSLLNDKTTSITTTGAPQSKKNFIFLNPWDSPAYTASQLLEASLKRGLRTIVYTQSRKMTELISLWTRPRLGSLADKLSSYRAGFLPEERREIENNLADGSLLGVISTSALELGIDIGDLDICILVGYPGSIMASYQRSGRVGRGGRESLVIMVASDDALDQYFMKNPQNFFSRQVESAVLNPHNENIMKKHLVCAAAELPIKADENLMDNDLGRSCVNELVEEGALLQSMRGNEYYAARKRPQRAVSLRGSGSTVTIINGDSGMILGDVDNVRALKECHEGAIYLHQNRTWLVDKLDLGAKEVVVIDKPAPYYTRAMSHKNTEILAIQSSRQVFGGRLSFGKLKVTEKINGYQKRNKGTHKLITTIPLELPEQIIETEGFWYEIPSAVVKSLEENKLHFMGGLHAFEHVLISVFPLLVLCDRNDVGGISCPHHEQTEGATIFIYDGYSGGSGLSAEAYKKAEKLMRQSLDIVDSCECENGCPSCVHSPKCGSGNKPIDKESCLQLINAVLLHSFQESEWNVQHNSALSTKDNPPHGSLPQSILPDISATAVLPDHYGVYDLETKRSAAEVGGWHHADKMGVSVAVVYDSKLDGFVTYLEHEVDQLITHLNSLQLIVGFNNKRFDNRVLSGYTQMNLAGLPTLDLLEEVSGHLGYRLSLDALAEHTLGIKKSGDGLLALQWYQEGNFDKLRKYCQKDVAITRDLFIHGLDKGFLLFRNKAKKIVRLPLRLGRSISRQLVNK